MLASILLQHIALFCGQIVREEQAFFEAAAFDQEAIAAEDQGLRFLDARFAVENEHAVDLRRLALGLRGLEIGIGTNRDRQYYTASFWRHLPVHRAKLRIGQRERCGTGEAVVLIVKNLAFGAK